MKDGIMNILRACLALCLMMALSVGLVGAQNTNALQRKDREAKLFVRQKLKEMSVREKVEQMLMLALRTWSDTPEDPDSFENVIKLNPELISLLQEHNFGGICLFGENCLNTEQLTRLTDEMQSAARASARGVPLLLAVDQEGGYITRLATGTSGIGNMALAATGDPDNARASAAIIGSELKALGINTDFAPDVDVNNNPDNPVIGIRSFSDDPNTVSEYASAFISGLQSQGILSCLKHFPGHGDTDTDSHTGLPLIRKTHEELQILELIPFASSLEKAEMVMVAHIQFPAIEAATYTSISSGETIYLPATLSKTLITDVLRGNLGFDGIIVSDSLRMDAISANFDPMDTARMAICAGVDVLLMPVEITSPEGIRNLEAYIAGIVSMVESGRIRQQELDDSVERILLQKYRSGCFAPPTEPLEDRIETALATVGSEAHHAAEWNMALSAVTLASGSADALRQITDDTRVLAVVPLDSMKRSVDLAVNQLISSGILTDSSNVTTLSFDGLNDDNREEMQSEAEQALAGTDMVLIVTRFQTAEQANASLEENLAAHYVQHVLAQCEAADKPAIVISSHMPYDAAAYPSAAAVLLAYNPSTMKEVPTRFEGNTQKYGANVPAALYIALSGRQPTGVCPVKLPED